LPLYRLDHRIAFPDPREAEEDGLLAVAGDLSPARLLLAYSLGIFPWFNEGDPILWWSPPKRCVVLRGQERISKSLRKTLRQGRFEIRFDTAFETVMRACGRPRGNRDGTWITEAMVQAYTALHRAGFAHSVEAWREGELVGGLYGVSLGAIFFGESMFSLEPDASKVAFATLCERCWAWDFAFIDAQVETEHLKSLGAVMISREDFLDRLDASLEAATRQGNWG
jgi:leucyl/phenylalanyl-tRNA--protein transferase